ncbi:MAG TPA: serine hydrolase [Candidatus Saccharimonadales bacterium]|nr:serine hydrolase [Candidatus Saccharimonadales bacterium]
MNEYRAYRPNRPQVKPARGHGRLKLILALVVVAAITVGCFRVLGDHKISNISALSKIVSHNQPKTITPLVLDRTRETIMASKIKDAIKAYPDMGIGVAIEDLNDRKIYTYGLTEPFIAASVGKLITATMYLQGSESGKYSLSRHLSYGTAGYELQRMIIISDNTAWDDLARVLTHRGMEAYMQALGVTDYDPSDNTLAPADIALLLGKLYKGELLNSADTQLLLSYMQQADYSTYIPASVPPRINVYHKAGWLGDRVHDAAIIDNGRHPYVLVIFSKMNSGGTYNTTEGHQLYATITTATLNAFTQ